MKQHVITVFKKSTDFNGRASRAEFWWFFLFNLIVSWGISFAGAFVLPAALLSIVSLVVTLIFILPGVAVMIRRAHDVNKSGWYMLIPIYGLILAITQGDQSENKYGPDPYNPDPSFDFERNPAK
ncbi:DUF805 domain-containing protein [Chitinophaga sp. NPDC101104]|uniref:DUF805 domain-containing protein n=1 Tax=Chitinophaga sp. NPDC101104 TaxID=3390561 RepID=UPI003D06D6CC